MPEIKACAAGCPAKVRDVLTPSKTPAAKAPAISAGDAAFGKATA